MSEIKTAVSTINNFLQEGKLLKNSVLYFCESHSNRFDAKNHLRSTANLLHRFQIELRPCEKYELRTGFLSRWNYMPKNINLLSPEEIATAINLGYQEELDWTIR